MKLEKNLKHTEMWMILIAAGSLLLRLIGLGSSSLTLNEAENALSALHLFSQGEGNLLYCLPTALIFKLFGRSDFSARLFPAIMGSMLSVLPLFLRKTSGNRKALIWALLLAADPTLLFWSKRADALVPSIALFAGACIFFYKEKTWAAVFCLLAALCGGNRCLPALLIITLASVLYTVLIRRSGTIPGLLSKHCTKRSLACGLLLFILCCTAFGAFPGGISLFGSGITDSFREYPAWTKPGAAASVIAVIVYLGIPVCLFICRCFKSNNLPALLITAAGTAGLILWTGIAAMPWLAFIFLPVMIEPLERCFEIMKKDINMSFFIVSFITAGAYAFFYFRMVELFSQRNGNELIQVTWNDTVQTLPLTRFAGSILLTVLSVVIIVLVIRILLGFFESDTVRRGILAGMLTACTWGLITNIWNTGGFDRIADHPAAAHLKNSYNLLNGDYTSLTDTPLFNVIEETVQKHGDTTGKTFGLNFAEDDPILEWELLSWSGIRQSGNLNTDLNGIDLILDRSGNAFAEHGYVGSQYAYRSAMDWEKLSFQNWGKWLIFGDANEIIEPPITLWVKGNYIYSAGE